MDAFGARFEICVVFGPRFGGLCAAVGSLCPRVGVESDRERERELVAVQARLRQGGDEANKRISGGTRRSVDGAWCLYSLYVLCALVALLRCGVECEFRSVVQFVWCGTCSIEVPWGICNVRWVHNGQWFKRQCD